MNAGTQPDPANTSQGNATLAWSTGEQDTIHSVLRRAVSQYGDRQFLDFLGQRYSFNDIDRHACQLANGLKGLGVSKGQTVVTLLDNCAEAVMILFAITK